MDRMIYIAMTGAQQALQQQAVSAHNLANAGTAGFKADTTAFRTLPVDGPGLPTRAYAVDTTTGADLAPGTIQRTGRELDVAIQSEGFFAVQALDGTEAYTRGGSFEVSAEGQLQTHSGLPVLGDGGPLTIPQDSKVSVAADGTISATNNGMPATTTVVGRLKLVNPPAGALSKGSDGLFRMAGGAAADADPNVAVIGGAIESSNVNPVSSMVEMINLSRQFDLTMKFLQAADTNAQKATQLLAAVG
jgi:flagellar basal-body rod protein FlgF